MKALAIAALASLAAPQQQEYRVKIEDGGFMPRQVEVNAGDKVVWMNASKGDHTVTAQAPAEAQDEKKPAFDSGPIKPGASWEFTFSTPGTYTYGCQIDKTMTGVVVVRERQ